MRTVSKYGRRLRPRSRDRPLRQRRSGPKKNAPGNNPERPTAESFLEPAHFGMITASITWITPLSQTMSVLITFALSTFTPFLAST
jgi:hypothetical protein